MTKLWQLINGKKTNTAAIVAMLSAFLSQVVVKIWGLDAAWMSNIIATIDWIVMVLGTVGLGHKGVKKIDGDSKMAAQAHRQMRSDNRMQL